MGIEFSKLLYKYCGYKFASPLHSVGQLLDRRS
jgi:hypothetical protein